MEKLEIINRKELIRLYLEGEIEKKQKPIPHGYDLLDWEDPNNLDVWLEKYCYKHGTMAGFKKWARVNLSREDLMGCAIVTGIFCETSHPLGNFVNTKKFKEWEPKPKNPIWYEPLSNGDFQEKFAVIVRPACEDEMEQGAKYYVEDGSGRMICYLRNILNSNSKSAMTAYFGFDPDRGSNFLDEKLHKTFSNGGNEKYTTFEQTIQTINEEIGNDRKY